MIADQLGEDGVESIPDQFESISVGKSGDRFQIHMGQDGDFCVLFHLLLFGYGCHVHAC
ncbi:MAG: hypothetical protein BWY82_01306 [Verrucomicrobia bacterium ADurb.Bin474]|nr:MAG: hypothetical protein BWY82_01306 [Verrucomicrobia bacterium ADurb.Bin474]